MARQDSLQALVDDYYACQQVRTALNPVKDIERLLARVVYQSANARDLLALLRSLSVLPELRRQLPAGGNWPRLLDHLQVDEELVALLARTAADKGATIAQIAIAWLLHQRPWIVPIPGTTRLHRLDENLGAADIALSDADLTAIGVAAAAIEIEIEGARYTEAMQATVDS